MINKHWRNSHFTNAETESAFG